VAGVNTTFKEWGEFSETYGCESVAVIQRKRNILKKSARWLRFNKSSRIQRWSNDTNLDHMQINRKHMNGRNLRFLVGLVLDGGCFVGPKIQKFTCIFYINARNSCINYISKAAYFHTNSNVTLRKICPRGEQETSRTCNCLARNFSSRSCAYKAKIHYNN